MVIQNRNTRINKIAKSQGEAPRWLDKKCTLQEVPLGYNAGDLTGYGAIKVRELLIRVLLLICVFVPFQEALGENYSSLLVNGLLKLDYPLDRDDVVALDMIGMRFDGKNRLEVVSGILEDREQIHGMQGLNSAEKTQVICNALRLLDELDLPKTREIIATLAKEERWQERELRLLAYMAARRNIEAEHYIQYLIGSIPRQGSDLAPQHSGEVSLAIMDICDTISFLTELFVYRGDRGILDALVKYAGHVYGYPKEYLSYMFVEMFLQRPKLFITVLSKKDERSAGVVINSMLFAMWKGDVRGKIGAILTEELNGDEYDHNQVLIMLKKRLESYSYTHGSTNAKSKTSH